MARRRALPLLVRGLRARAELPVTRLPRCLEHEIEAAAIAYAEALSRRAGVPLERAAREVAAELRSLAAMPRQPLNGEPAE